MVYTWLLRFVNSCNACSKKYICCFSNLDACLKFLLDKIPSISAYSLFSSFMPILLLTSFQSTVLRYFYPIISFFFSSILYLNAYIYSLKNLYSIFVSFDSWSKFITNGVVIPLINNVRSEFAVTWIRKKFLAFSSYCLF